MKLESIDYDTNDFLYFEPVTVEGVLIVIDFGSTQWHLCLVGGQMLMKLTLPIQHYLDVVQAFMCQWDCTCCHLGLISEFS